MVMLIGAFVCVPVIAQDVVTPTNGVVMGFETFAALVAIIPFLTELLKKIPGVSGIVIQIVSWALGVLLALVGWKFNLGFLSGIPWYIATLYGIGAGLVANGIFDTGIITWILGLFGKSKAS